MPQISKKEAENIAKKLGSSPKTGGKKHLRSAIYVDGTLWRTFGFSHGKHNSNMQILAQLGVSYVQARDLAHCSLSKKWYFDKIREERARSSSAAS